MSQLSIVIGSGIHEILLARPSNRDAMVPAANDVHLATLEKLDRGQRYLLAIGLVNADPAVLGAVVAGEENAVEVTGTPGAWRGQSFAGLTAPIGCWSREISPLAVAPAGHSAHNERSGFSSGRPGFG